MAGGRRNRGEYHIIMHILLKQSVTAHCAEFQTGLMLVIVCLAWSIRIQGVCACACACAFAFACASKAMPAAGLQRHRRTNNDIFVP